MAAGHVRYSTTGGAGLRNVQPLYADLASGGFAVAHNGNISNAGTLREELVQRGAIFQSTSDTEVIIHLVATSRYPTIVDRLASAPSEALKPKTQEIAVMFVDLVGFTEYSETHGEIEVVAVAGRDV